MRATGVLRNSGEESNWRVSALGGRSCSEHSTSEEKSNAGTRFRWDILPGERFGVSDFE